MDNLIINYDKLSENQTKDFINALFLSKYFNIDNILKDNNEKIIFNYLSIWSHIYIEKLKLNRIHVSIR
jgi:hypothetical protein